MLLSGTDVTSFHVLLYESAHCGPPVLSFNSFQGAMDTRVTRGRIIVALSENDAPELIVRRHIDSGACTAEAAFEGVDDHVGSSEFGKHLRFEYNLLSVVLRIGDLMDIKAG